MSQNSLSERDALAEKILFALLASTHSMPLNGPPEEAGTFFAVYSYALADAMLAARKGGA